jgi:hypothetical protein
MDSQKLEIAIKAALTEMRDRLQKAASIARVAEACADAGSIEKAVQIALELEELIYEVNAFLNAASMISRLGKADRPDAGYPNARRTLSGI